MLNIGGGGGGSVSVVDLLALRAHAFTSCQARNGGHLPRHAVCLSPSRGVVVVSPVTSLHFLLRSSSLMPPRLIVHPVPLNCELVPHDLFCLTLRLNLYLFLSLKRLEH